MSGEQVGEERRRGREERVLCQENRKRRRDVRKKHEAKHKKRRDGKRKRGRFVEEVEIELTIPFFLTRENSRA